MPTASITLTSTDIAGDPVNISRSSTYYKAGTETPLDQTAGLNKLILTTTTNKELYIATAAGDNKAAKMYICNKSETPSEYVTITINAQDIGKLYAGDWMFIPWSQTDTSASLKVAATNWTSSTGDVPIEYTLFHEDTDLLTDA